MSVNTGRNTPDSQTAMGQAMSSAGVGRPDQQAQQQPQQPHMDSRQETAGRRAVHNLYGMGQILPAPIGRGSTSEALSKLQKAVEEGVKSLPTEYEINLLPIDLNNYRVPLSMLVFCLRVANNKGAGVAYHTLLVAGSANDFSPLTENYPGSGPITLERVAGDAWGAEVRKVVQDVVARNYPQSKLISADGEVVPRDFNVNDPERVSQLVSNAGIICATELSRHLPGFQDLDLTKIDAQSGLTARVSFKNPQFEDRVGQPQRGDVSIDMTEATRMAGSEIADLMTSGRTVTNARGFIDLVYDPVEQRQNPYQRMQGNQQRATQMYSARFVLTQVESEQLVTLPATMLALGVAAGLAQDNMWVNNFRKGHVGGLNMHDIGAVNIEANLDNEPNGVGTMYDTQVDSFSTQDLFDLAEATIQPGLTISVDVPECGPQTAYMGVLAAAAEQDGVAVEQVLAAVNTLTGGHFGRIFQGGPIATDSDNRIQLGYYMDQQGIRRDIRDVDYLAVAVLRGQNRPEMISDWSETFVSNYPLNQRLAARKRILQDLFPSFVLTGYARRVTFTAEFIGALQQALSNAGLRINMLSQYADQGTAGRHSATFTKDTRVGAGQTGMFQNRGPGAGAQAGSGYNRFGGRFNY